MRYLIPTVLLLLMTAAWVLPEAGADTIDSVAEVELSAEALTVATVAEDNANLRSTVYQATDGGLVERIEFETGMTIEAPVRHSALFDSRMRGDDAVDQNRQEPDTEPEIILLCPRPDSVASRTEPDGVRLWRH